MALTSASVLHAARGPSPLKVRLIVGHGAGVSGEPRPGRPDAAGTRGRLLDGRLPTGCLETRGDPGQAEECQPRNHPASQASAGGQAPERRGGARQCVPSRRGSRVRLPSMSAPRHAVTLSDAGRHGERAHCRRSVWLPGQCGSLAGAYRTVRSIIFWRSSRVTPIVLASWLPAEEVRKLARVRGGAGFPRCDGRRPGFRRGGRW